VEYTRGRQEGQSSRQGSGTFTGRTTLDPVLADDAGKVRVNSVFFEPGARTFWHSHADGQVLLAVSGRGIVETRDGDRRVLRPGDTVWAPPGEEHWHGAAPDSLLLHTAISLGVTEWREEVPAEHYDTAFKDEQQP
jgi:quercetin dioxygenase-like cupin family protein